MQPTPVIFIPQFPAQIFITHFQKQMLEYWNPWSSCDPHADGIFPIKCMFLSVKKPTHNLLIYHLAIYIKYINIKIVYICIFNLWDFSCLYLMYMCVCPTVYIWSVYHVCTMPLKIRKGH